VIAACATTLSACETLVRVPTSFPTFAVASSLVAVLVVYLFACAVLLMAARKAVTR
jgi:hypothetical protein